MSYDNFPANIKYLFNIRTTSAQRLWRWSNIVRMFYGFMFCVYGLRCIFFLNYRTLETYTLVCIISHDWLFHCGLMGAYYTWVELCSEWSVTDTCHNWRYFHSSLLFSLKLIQFIQALHRSAMFPWTWWRRIIHVFSLVYGRSLCSG